MKFLCYNLRHLVVKDRLWLNFINICTSLCSLLLGPFLHLSCAMLCGLIKNPWIKQNEGHESQQAVLHGSAEAENTLKLQNTLQLSEETKASSNRSPVLGSRFCIMLSCSLECPKHQSPIAPQIWKHKCLQAVDASSSLLMSVYRFLRTDFRLTPKIFCESTQSSNNFHALPLQFHSISTCQ